MLPISLGNELFLVNAVSGEVLSSFALPKNNQTLLGDVDGALLENETLGALDLLNVNSKMIWSSSSNSALSPQRFGKAGEAMLCKVDADSLADYAVRQSQSLLLQSSLTGQRLKLALRRFGSVQALLCGAPSSEALVDSVYILHPAKKVSAASARASARALTSQLTLSRIDLQTRTIIETLNVNLRRVKQMVLADTDGDGTSEACLVRGGSRNSSIICINSKGQFELSLPFGIKQLSSGDYLPDNSADGNPIDELAVLTSDKRVLIVSREGVERELLLSNLSSQTMPKGRAKLPFCR